jgi:pimeloyl-ACP methyl ester carboxylesterase
VLCELLAHWGLDGPAIAAHDIGGAITLRAHLLEGRDFSKLTLLDAVAPWGRRSSRSSATMSRSSSSCLRRHRVR